MSRQIDRSLTNISGFLSRAQLWIYLSLAILTGIIIYAPAMSGPFVFDDLAQPYSNPGVQSPAIWITVVRPLLMASFWLNYRLSGVTPDSYHWLNLLFHLANSVLVFFIIGRLLRLDNKGRTDEAESRHRLLALFGALLFLVHPLQTESVSYVASRSENMSAFFMLAAYLIFLDHAGPRMNWKAAIAIVGTFALAGATKEVAIALVPLIILTDWFFATGGVRRNWRLYGLLSVGAVGACGLAFMVLRNARSAGFAMPGVHWYEYLFTQFRALVVYLRLYLLPVGQTLDHDFPVSRTIFQYGSWAGLLVLAALTVVAIRRRKSWGLISFGILAWLALISPTSSVMPIRDSLVEHRMYLPILGLIVATVALADRARKYQSELTWGLAALLVVLSADTFYRNTLWSDPVRLWQEAVNAAPKHGRPYSNLSSLYLARGKCGEASKVLSNAPPGWQADYYAFVTWGIAESCLEHYDRAVNLLRQGFTVAGSTWENKPAEAEAKLEMLIGWTLLKKGDQGGSIDALDRALQLDPALDMAYVYRGRWKQRHLGILEAAKDYQRALELNPRNPEARQDLENILQGAERQGLNSDGSN